MYILGPMETDRGARSDDCMCRHDVHVLIARVEFWFNYLYIYVYNIHACALVTTDAVYIYIYE